VKTASSFSAAKRVRAIEGLLILGGVSMANSFAGPSIDPMERNLAAAVARNRKLQSKPGKYPCTSFGATIFGA
jgi:hypothetical protein